MYTEHCVDNSLLRKKRNAFKYWFPSFQRPIMQSNSSVIMPSKSSVFIYAITYVKITELWIVNKVTITEYVIRTIFRRLKVTSYCW